jgi:hypothetical protein
VVPASGSPVLTVRQTRAGQTALGVATDHFGWTGCRILGTGGLDATDWAAVRRGAGAAVDARDAADGWVGFERTPDGEPGAAWVGTDLVGLARSVGATLLVLDGSSRAWLATDTRVDEWRSIRTPGRRTAWVETGAMVAPDGPCVTGGTATP